MDVAKRIELFIEFFENNHKSQILANFRNDKKYIELTCQDILNINPELGDDLLDDPEQTITAAEVAVKQCTDLVMAVCITNLPKRQYRNPWEVRSEDIGRLIALTGIINKLSGIMHICTSTDFECPSCGNHTHITMRDNKYVAPKQCACGRKGEMRRVREIIKDQLTVGITDDLMGDEMKDRSVVREKLAVLEQEQGLTSKDVDNLLKIGQKIVLNGYFKYVQEKKESVEFRTLFYVNSLEIVKVGWDTIKLTESESERIVELSTEPDIIQRMANSVTDISGHDEVKVACLLLLAGAPNMYDLNKHLVSRGTIHVLLIGDPGSGKTYIAKRFGSLSPIYAYQSAANASGRGMTCAVAQDADLKVWVVYPGIIPMCHKGVACIDEVDKTNEDDYGDHNTAMNDMMISVAKANVKARLQTETCYLAMANPEHREFVSQEEKYNQINMPKDFQDRFDIIFPMETPTDSGQKKKIMDIMLDRHHQKKDETLWKPEFSHGFIQKYIAYCRRTMPEPKLSRELNEHIQDKLIQMMKPKQESQVKISYRQLECILRFSYAAARLRLHENITKEDIDLAFTLKEKSFKGLGLMEEGGGISWGRIEGIDKKRESDDIVVREVLEDMLPNNEAIVDIMDVESVCVSKGIDKFVLERIIERFKTKGDIYEPKRGKLRRL